MIKLYRVIDNPDYFDRFTLCFASNEGPFVYGASENPYHPQGFGQYGGDMYFGPDQTLGEEIPRDELPEPVQRLVASIEGE